MWHHGNVIHAILAPLFAFAPRSLRFGESFGVMRWQRRRCSQRILLTRAVSTVPFWQDAPHQRLWRFWDD